MESLTPRQVALAIGVSEASLKRWCDRGIIPSVRTAGGHRRIPLNGVLAYIRTSHRPPVRPEILGLPSTTGTGRTVEHRAHEQLFEALQTGDEEAGLRICFDLHLAGFSAQALGDRLIAPVFARIGDSWAHGQTEEYQERRACEICLRCAHRLHATLPHSVDGPLAIGCAPESDPYCLPTAWAELALREAGWRAQSFGSNVPLASLAAAVEGLRPRLVWLSVSWLRDPAFFAAEFGGVTELAGKLGIALVIGGNGLVPDLRAKLVSVNFGETFADLLDFARRAPGAPDARIENPS